METWQLLRCLAYSRPNLICCGEHHFLLWNHTSDFHDQAAFCRVKKKVSFLDRICIITKLHSATLNIARDYCTYIIFLLSFHCVSPCLHKNQNEENVATENCLWSIKVYLHLWFFHGHILWKGATALAVKEHSKGLVYWRDDNFAYCIPSMDGESKKKIIIK